jgi:NCAIR mutase (PurE)-related protein
MDVARLTRLLEEVQRGEVSIPQALDTLRTLPFEDLGFAKVDTHRDLRTGFPEVVFCQGKTIDQIYGIITSMSRHQRITLATRLSAEAYRELAARGLEGTYHEQARILVLYPPPQAAPEPHTPPCGKGGEGGYVVVACAGTADLPVAEEAAVTASTMGSRVERIYDIGIAGIHRVLMHHTLLAEAHVIVVVAGMEGALPSVIAGLVDRPVIGVPTSVGYGASFGGLAPLLTMLNSCAAGVAVVNIDNGFGAGYLAHLINLRAHHTEMRDEG